MLWLITLAVTTLEKRVVCNLQVFGYTQEDAQTEGLCKAAHDFASERVVRIRSLSVTPLEMAVA